LTFRTKQKESEERVKSLLEVVEEEEEPTERR
jgi:hypothetical protein